MRLAVALLAAALGCSSRDAPAARADAGDARSACGVPGDDVECLCSDGQIGHGTCLATGGVDACECPAPIDSGAPADAAADASEAAPVDAGQDAAPDSSDALQESLCLAGAPRLVWSAGGCTDTGNPPELAAAFPCRFSTATDGKVRCLPPAAPYGGWSSSGCVGPPNVAAWTVDPVSPYVLGGPVGGPFTAARETYTGSSSFTPWYAREGATCVEKKSAYPYTTPKGLVVYLRPGEISIASFYAAKI